jgi:hypothetical protein
MEGTFRPLLSKLHDYASGGTCVALAWTLFCTASSCSWESSPAIGRADSKQKARGWQPATAEPRASERGREALDAGLDASQVDKSVSQSRPRVTRDAGTTAIEPRDAAPRPAADGGASSVMDAETPIPTMQPDAQQDASIAIDAATSLDASTSGERELPDCQPGQYTGDFSGELAAAGISVSVVAGPVTATLTLDADGRYLDLSDATVFGRDALGNTVAATLSGRVNCATLELEDSQLERGRYYIAARRASVSFDGVAHGTYATSPHGLTGTWSVSARIAEIITGEGEFTLVRSE